MIPTTDFWYVREIIPPNLEALCRRLADGLDVPATHIGCKGNRVHYAGYHRSRFFLLNSPHSENRTYSVAEAGNRVGNDNWICAIDISLDETRLIAMCKRLDAAVRSGKLEKVAEWYGNDDGDNRVDGYDNIRNRVATSDSSHLWHLHISILRDHANDNHNDLFEILMGVEDDMTPEQNRILLNVQGRVAEVYNILSTLKAQDKAAIANAAASATRDSVTVAAIAALASALKAGTGSSVDATVIVDAIHAEGEKTRALALKQAMERLNAINAAATVLAATK